jgi:tetratricopeptide (TPR) repeat protein
MWLDGSNTVADLGVVTQALKDGNYDVVRLHTKSGGNTYRRDRVCFRPFAKFVDRVHETLSADGLRATTLDTVITRTWQKKAGREDSLVRNIRLLRMMIAESGKNHPRLPRWVYYLARELRDTGKIDEALALFKERATLVGFWEERAQAALQVVHILKSRCLYNDAIRAAYDALKFCDGWRDAYYLIADCYFRLKNPKRAIAWLQHTLAVPETPTILWKWEAVYQYLPQLLLSNCYEELGIIQAALAWATEELKGAPHGQHARITARIEGLKRRMPQQLRQDSQDKGV